MDDDDDDPVESDASELNELNGIGIVVHFSVECHKFDLMIDVQFGFTARSRWLHIKIKCSMIFAFSNSKLIRLNVERINLNLLEDMREKIWKDNEIDIHVWSEVNDDWGLLRDGCAIVFD